MDLRSFYKNSASGLFTQLIRFRLVPFRSPLLRESFFTKAKAKRLAITLVKILFFSFPPATKMFQFTGLFTS